MKRFPLRFNNSARLYNAQRRNLCRSSLRMRMKLYKVSNILFLSPPSCLFLYHSLTLYLSPSLSKSPSHPPSLTPSLAIFLYLSLSPFYITFTVPPLDPNAPKPEGSIITPTAGDPLNVSLVLLSSQSVLLIHL